jgi:4-amino-4-deoxy-L-arabinose transferase-like glycosyltransferase
VQWLPQGAPSGVTDPAVPPSQPGRWRRLWRGHEQDPAWIRPALISLLAGTGLLYLWNLSASGWANSYYSAAVKAGTESWSAWFWGSLDSANFITVDKPPASLWVMGLSARIFGFNSWSVLAPQAVEGVLAVGVLYAAVRRWAGPRAGLLAGLALATTPVATLMFRFNNPDALLVLLMVLACYTMVRAVEKAAMRWVFLTGLIIGFAFLTKMLQGLILLPALALVYLVVANTTMLKRVRDVVVGGAGVVLGAGWWVAAVELTPAGSRPYIGGSNHNSILELTFGYNGIGRLTGSSNNGAAGGGGGGGGFSSGETGLGRLFGTDMGTQISWLLPASLMLLGAGLWFTRRRPRTDLLRATLLLWGGWLVVNGLVFSYASGIIHPYYTVALAAPIAAVVGVGFTLLWRIRKLLAARLVLAATLAVTAGWTIDLLGRASSWHPELRWLVALGAVVAIGALFVPRRMFSRIGIVAGAASVLTLVAAPAAYSLQTASVAHSGSLPTAGPSATGGFGGGGPGGGRGGFGGGAPGGGTGAGTGGFGGGGTGGQAGGPTGGQAGGTTGGQGGGGGVALNGTTVSAELTAALEADKDSYTWSAATVSANEAGSMELATNTAVMSLGGFNGTDPAISLDAFKKLVAAGKIHYFIAGGQGSFIGSTQSNTSTAYQIQQWIESNFTASTIGTTTVYDLSGGATS